MGMTDKEICEILRDMLCHWDACMQLVMLDTGKSKSEAAEIVGKLFTTLTKVKPEAK